MYDLWRFSILRENALKGFYSDLEKKVPSSSLCPHSKFEISSSTFWHSVYVRRIVIQSVFPRRLPNCLFGPLDKGTSRFVCRVPALSCLGSTTRNTLVERKKRRRTTYRNGHLSILYHTKIGRNWRGTRFPNESRQESPCNDKPGKGPFFRQEVVEIFLSSRKQSGKVSISFWTLGLLTGAWTRTVWRWCDIYPVTHWVKGSLLNRLHTFLPCQRFWWVGDQYKEIWLNRVCFKGLVVYISRVGSFLLHIMIWFVCTPLNGGLKYLNSS